MEIGATVVLVAGGASGLGAATAHRLCKAGAKVVVADKDVARGEVVGRDGVVFVPTDVTKPEQVQAAIDRACELGPLRVAVTSAGFAGGARVVAKDGTPHDLDLLRQVLEVNLIGTLNVLCLAAAAMTGTEAADDGERGVIVNVSSIAAFEGRVGQLAYATAKAGVVGLTLPAARDLARFGVRVVTIAPGMFETSMLAVYPPAQQAGLAAAIPFPPRPGRSEEFAALVEHVITNPYLNGETIRLDGALRLPPQL